MLQWGEIHVRNHVRFRLCLTTYLSASIHCAIDKILMKCFKHKTEAIAVCAYCGRAMCEECVPSVTAPRMVCSPECGASLAQHDRGMQSILQKSVQGLKASAFYCYLCGGLSAAAAVTAWFLLPSTQVSTCAPDGCDHA